MFASISLAKIKRIQAVVKFDVFLIQKIECTHVKLRITKSRTRSQKAQTAATLSVGLGKFDAGIGYTHAHSLVLLVL